MKRKLIVAILLLMSILITGCGTEKTSQNISEESVSETFENSFIKFSYNPNKITNIDINEANGGIEGMDCFITSKLLDDPVSSDVSGMMDVTATTTIVADTEEAVYALYQQNYKLAFSLFLTGILGTEITEDDIIGKPSDSIECDKVSTNGDIIKAKLLSINENKLCVVVCHIVSDIEPANQDEIMAVYNSVVYKESN